MFKKSYKGRRIKLVVKKSLAVPVAIVTSFIVILVVSLSPLVNKGLVNTFSRIQLYQLLQQHQQRQNQQQIW